MSGESTLIVNVSFPSEYPSAVAIRFNVSETKICKLPSKGRMVVQKNKQMIMSDSATASQMSTNSETIIYSKSLLFNNYWSNESTGDTK